MNGDVTRNKASFNAEETAGVHLVRCGGRLTHQRRYAPMLDKMVRNRWTTSPGARGRLAPELLDGITGIRRSIPTTDSGHVDQPLPRRRPPPLREAERVGWRGGGSDHLRVRRRIVPG